MHLELGDDELTRLLPMVQDLQDVAQTLRHDQRVAIDRARPGDLVSDQSG
jgi:hypothetical protein